MYFIFYFFYLIAAQFPLFLLLIVRNSSSTYTLFIYLFILSISLLVILLFFTKNRLLLKKRPSSNIHIESDNLANNTMSEFFSFFLLPFFTFNLTSSNSIKQQLVEITFIFLMLTLFLYRSGNLLINPIIFFFFNLYKGYSAGNNYIILLPKNRSSSSVDKENRQNFIQITNKITYFHYDDMEYQKTLAFIKKTIFFLLFVLLFSVMLLIDRSVYEMIFNTKN